MCIYTAEQVMNKLTKHYMTRQLLVKYIGGEDNSLLPDCYSMSGSFLAKHFKSVKFPLCIFVRNIVLF